MQVFPALERKYNRDEFLFLVFILFLVGCAFTIRSTPDKILNRNQTEEWKGWMQVMFVWYHYFAAKEWYNWIRLYIACYVWMTGFGNFSFFWLRKDFSFWRMLKMLFRLNFLVIFVVMVTDNQYMLYYICAMHTYWFFTVYVFMGVLSSWNEHRFKMAIKFAVYFVCNALIFDVPGVAPVIFRPLQVILGYRERKYNMMHEWTFRVGLDHWVCFVGMLCAYNYPHFESFIKFVEETSASAREKYTKWAMKMALVLIACLVGVSWYVLFMGKDKFAYNRIHPYTSFIPIVVFIVLRNSFPFLRRYYVYMFEWLGKITLETYLSQLHVYLQSNAKHLIGYIPGYHLLNFALATIIYLGISHALFNLTTEFSTYLIPKDMKTVLRHVILGAVIGALAVGVAFWVKSVIIL
ncbi:protein REDUCED WALL ACETYLATION 2-like isoform X2 [Gigantopelta aegis]|uniref:protein REDUCED WALL ACETYLATION 2-like isoform X2 n=1 Tax=Gigantopelta aegis TaxID=1735272 RepID=UPI001B8890D5|nr:protein REDUCED WALL ACETYLATION 2-like isoform X2 [Gigantopelta aegis]